MKAAFLIGRRLFGGFFLTTESITCGSQIHGAVRRIERSTHP
jgi:hypothetical protein